MAKEAHDPSKPTDHLLNNPLAQDPLLEELYHNRDWVYALDIHGVSWAKDPSQAANWYRQFIQAKAMAQPYRSAPNNRVKLWGYILENIIFHEGPINDFFAMEDLYWDAHKYMVKNFLTHIFRMHATKGFTAFTQFWDYLAPKWTIAAAFYNRLVTIVLQNSTHYETMIGTKTQRWDHERILLIDKLILKLALAELIHCKEIPLKVSINEYIEIAKGFSTAQSGCFINGVLEGILQGMANEK